MRIGLNLLFLIPRFVGGTETYTRGLLKALAELSDSSEYYVFVNRDAKNAIKIHKKGWNFILCPFQARHRFVRYIWEQFILPIQAKILRLDLLHSLGYVQPIRAYCKTVVTIHDLNFHNIGYMFSWTRRVALRYFVTQSAKTADHIITVSNFSKKQIVNLLGVPSEKVTVIYNSVDKKLMAPVGLNELKHSYGINQPYILCLSSPSPHKNIFRAIKAFEYLKRNGYHKLQLVLVGHLPIDKGELMRTIYSSDSRKDIIFTGYINDRILAGLYSYAEVFLFPSLYEGFGIPILEAFFYGTPIVCSKAAAIPEVAGNSAVFFDPYDPIEMALALSSVLSNATLKKEMIESGKRRIMLFSWEKTAEQTLNVYHKVIGQR